MPGTGWSLSLTFLTATPQGRAFCCHPCFRDEENESLVRRQKHGSKRQNQDLKLGGRTPSPHSEHPHPAPTIRSQPAPHLWKSSPPALHAQSQTLHAPGPHLSQSALGPVMLCNKPPEKTWVVCCKKTPGQLQVSCSLAAFIRRLLCARQSSQSDPQDPGQPAGDTHKMVTVMGNVDTVIGVVQHA